jgi:hypothetical protein
VCAQIAVRESEGSLATSSWTSSIG